MRTLDDVVIDRCARAALSRLTHLRVSDRLRALLTEEIRAEVSEADLERAVAAYRSLRPRGGRREGAGRKPVGDEPRNARQVKADLSAKEAADLDYLRQVWRLSSDAEVARTAITVWADETRRLRRDTDAS